MSLIIQFEPSWFAEFMSAMGMYFWGAFALMTDDFIRTPFSWMLPLGALIFGPARLLVLFGLRAELRVIAAMVSFIVWASVLTGLYRRMGVVPSEGLYIAIALGDVLTVGKFSLVARSRQHDC